MNRTADSLNRLTEALLQNDALANIVGVTGADLLSDTTKSSAGIMFVAMKDWDERRELGANTEDIVASANEAVQQSIPEAHGLVVAPFISLGPVS